MPEDFLIQFGIDPTIPGLEEIVNKVVNAITAKPIEIKDITIAPTALRNLSILISRRMGRIVIPEVQVGKIKAPEVKTEGAARIEPPKIPTKPVSIKVRFLYGDAWKQLQKVMSSKTLPLKIQIDLRPLKSQIERLTKAKSLDVKIGVNFQEALKKLRQSLEQLKIKINLDYAESLQSLRDALAKTPIQARVDLITKTTEGIKSESLQRANEELSKMKQASEQASSGIEKLSTSQQKATGAVGETVQSMERIQIVSQKAKKAFTGLDAATKQHMQSLIKATESFRRNVEMYRQGSSQHGRYARSNYQLAQSIKRILEEEKGLTDVGARLKQVTGMTFSDMSQRLKEAESSFSRLSGATKRTEAGIKGFASGFEKLGREERQAAAAMIKISNSMDRLVPQYKAGSAYHANLIARKAEYITRLEQELRAKGKLIDIEKVFQQATGRTIEQQKQLGKEAARFAVTSGYGQETAFANIGRVAKNAFRRVAIWGTATAIFYGLVRALRSVVDITKEVESGITELRKVMNEAVTDFRQMEKEAFQLAYDLGQSIQDVLDTMAIFGRQGLKQAEVIQMTRTALLASNVTTMKAAEAAEALTAAVRQFSISYEDSERILDAWNNVANKNAVTAKQLAEAVSLGGVAARTAGVSFEQYTAITSALAEATRQAGSTLGRSLRMVFTRMYRPESLRALEQLNIRVREGTKSYRSAWNILSDLASVWPRLTRAQQINIATSMVGRRRYNDLVVILQNWNRVLKALRDAQTSAGSAALENVKYMRTYEKQVARLTASFQQLQVAIGEAGLLDILRAITEGLRGAVPTMIKGIERFGQAPMVAAASALAGAFVISFGGRAIKGLSESASVIFGPEVQTSYKKLAWKTFKGIGATIAGAMAAGYASSFLQEWAAKNQSVWKKVLADFGPFIASIGTLFAGVMTKQPLLLMLGLGGAIQTAGQAAKGLTSLFEDQATKIKRQIGLLFDQASVLEEISTLTKEIADLQEKVKTGEAGITDLLLKQKELTSLIASQYPELVAGVTDLGIVFAKTTRLGFEEIIRRYPVQFADKMKQLEKEIAGTSFIPELDTSDYEKAWDIIEKRPELARKTFERFTFIAPIEKPTFLKDFFSKREQALLENRIQSTTKLLEVSIGKIRELRGKLLDALTEKIAERGRKPEEAKIINEAIADLISSLRTLESKAIYQIDFATSIIRSTLASGLNDVAGVMKNEADVVANLINLYAQSFNLSAAKPTIEDQTIAIRRVLEKLFSLTEEEAKEANVDQVIYDWLREYKGALDRGGGEAEVAIAELGKRLEQALKKANVVLADSLQALAFNWKDFADAIKKALSLPLAVLDKFAQELSSKIDNIASVLEKRPTVGLVDVWNQEVRNLNTLLRGLSIEALAVFPTPGEFFRKARGKVSPEIRAFIGEAEYGVDAFRKVMETGIGAIDLSDLPDKIKQFMSYLASVEFPDPGRLVDIFWELAHMDIDLPVKQWASMTLRAQALVKHINYINAALREMGVEGIKAGDMLQRMEETGEGAADTAKYYNINQEKIIESLGTSYDLMQDLTNEAKNLLSVHLKLLDVEEQRKNLVKTILDRFKNIGAITRQSFTTFIKLGKDAYGTVKDFVKTMAAGFPSPFEEWRRDVLGVKISQSDLMASTENLLYIMSLFRPSKELDNLMKQYAAIRKEIEETKRSQQSLTDYYLMSAKEQSEAAVAYTYLMSIKSRQGILQMTDRLKEIIRRTPFLKALYEKKITEYFPEIAVTSDEAAEKLKEVNKEAASLFEKHAKDLIKAFAGADTQFDETIKEISRQISEQSKQFQDFKEAVGKSKEAADKMEQSGLTYAEAALKIYETSQDMLTIVEKEKSVADIFSNAVSEFKDSVSDLRDFITAPPYEKEKRKILESNIPLWEKVLRSFLYDLEHYKPKFDIDVNIGDRLKELMEFLKRPPVEKEKRKILESEKSIWKKLFESWKLDWQNFWDFLFGAPKSQQMSYLQDTLSPPSDFWRPIQSKLIDNLRVQTVQAQAGGAQLYLTINIGDIHAERPEQVREIVYRSIDESIEKIEDAVNRTLFKGQVI